MKHVLGPFAFVLIALCAVTLVFVLEHTADVPESDPSASLGVVGRGLIDSGLLLRHDVSIEINGRDVALGFSRSGCDGLLLVSVLPRTAQGWNHMAPRLDLSTYRKRYFYNGTTYEFVPRFERLIGRLSVDLWPLRGSLSTPVIATAEAGNCGLLEGAMSVLESSSRTQT